MGVNLGGADVFVPEQFLDGAYVVACLEEMGGEGMAETVAAGVFEYAGTMDSGFDGALQVSLVDMMAAPRGPGRFILSVRRCCALSVTNVLEMIYQLAGAGWADARVSDGGTHRDMSVSYLSDALGDMARAALHLLRGGREATFTFEDEPGQHRWVLSRGDADSLRVRILWFEETYSSRRPEDGTEVFSCDCSVLEFVGPVSIALHHVLDDEGIEGYKRRWQHHDFPLDTYNEIQRLLAPQFQ